ncbi:uncharacterized protein LOC108908238 [Anoplophora glabripennis]|uniref:uncharacterized protein LOC108908238 n=1 Tax=Anoplophora glabripennis TaxID=217634 RepID=UPI0008736018|nr:uncharacterized protein LOC108908238 [Anoplophora glabripennis]
MDLLQSILRTCRAEEYTENFKSNDIDAFTLKILNDEDLKIIGIKEEDVRESILKQVSNLQIPSEKKVDIIVDRQYALVVLSTMSMHLTKHLANLTYALKREDIDLCDIKVAPAVDCLQHCLMSLERRLSEFDKKIFNMENSKKKKYHIVFPTVAVTALVLFACARYFKYLHK